VYADFGDRFVFFVFFAWQSMRGASSGSDLLHTVCGTPYYCAPEIINGAEEGYSGSKVDAWSCGVILYCLLTGTLPFQEEDMNKLFEQINLCVVDYPSWLPADAKDLIARLLVKDASVRYSLDDVKDHRWLRHGAEVVRVEIEIESGDSGEVVAEHEASDGDVTKCIASESDELTRSSLGKENIGFSNTLGDNDADMAEQPEYESTEGSPTRVFKDKKPSVDVAEQPKCESTQVLPTCAFRDKKPSVDVAERPGCELTRGSPTRAFRDKKPSEVASLLCIYVCEVLDPGQATDALAKTLRHTVETRMLNGRSILSKLQTSREMATRIFFCDLADVESHSYAVLCNVLSFVEDARSGELERYQMERGLR
jgi:serine/threonine protein kinase